MPANVLLAPARGDEFELIQLRLAATTYNFAEVILQNLGLKGLTAALLLVKGNPETNVDSHRDPEQLIRWFDNSQYHFSQHLLAAALINESLKHGNADNSTAVTRLLEQLRNDDPKKIMLACVALEGVDRPDVIEGLNRLIIEQRGETDLERSLLTRFGFQALCGNRDEITGAVSDQMQSQILSLAHRWLLNPYAKELAGELQRGSGYCADLIDTVLWTTGVIFQQHPERWSVILRPLPAQQEPAFASAMADQVFSLFGSGALRAAGFLLRTFPLSQGGVMRDDILEPLRHTETALDKRYLSAVRLTRRIDKHMWMSFIEAGDPESAVLALPGLWKVRDEEVEDQLISIALKPESNPTQAAVAGALLGSRSSQKAFQAFYAEEVPYERKLTIAVALHRGAWAMDPEQIYLWRKSVDGLRSA